MTLYREPCPGHAGTRDNSVCPPLSEALVRANFAHEHQIARVA